MKSSITARKNIISTQGAYLTWVNTGFIFAACLLLAYYIIAANGLASLNYRIQNLESDIMRLSEENATLSSQKVAIEDPSFLENFALGRGMVQAVNPRHIFAGNGVAFGR